MFVSMASPHPGVFLAVMCGLPFVEECGIPLPFGPGDVLLVICGTTISGGLSPLAGIPAALISVIAGALSGRKIFSGVGRNIAFRAAQLLHLEASPARALGMLTRGGWSAIALGRLTPGLRILTMEMAGTLGVPRKIFAAGLVPTACVYVAVFVGLGMVVGRSAADLIQSTSLWLAAGAAVVVAAMSIRWLRRVRLQPSGGVSV